MKLRLAIAANFTVEPLQESLLFWLSILGIKAEIKFTAYNQLFQQLLDPLSFLSQNQQGINVVIITPDKKKDVIDLIQVIKYSQKLVQASYILCLCPPSPEILKTNQETNLFAAEEFDTEGIIFVTYSELLATYPVLNYYDAKNKQIADIPYTKSFYTALGTIMARKVHAIVSNPYKVLVLDCDWTLWKGVCAELGFLGVEIDSSRLALQEFIIQQYQAGVLICLCSKNNPEDVLDVFNHNSNMLLKLEHIFSMRINWQSKSENLKSLAEELNLGLDSFIFIDDNPLECAEILANCPEVLTLQLPPDEYIPTFIKHIWALDRFNITNEDRQRTELYKQNIQRETLRKTTPTLAEFLANLELKVEITEINSSEIGRVSELTKRTNQFNFTTIRRSETEIISLCQSKEWHCLSVKVGDRFGDYGLVGVIFWCINVNTLKVDTFLLSCRVLGRGVEHQMLQYLAAIAQSQQLTYIDITYLPTNKNQPALLFLESINDCIKTNLSQAVLFRLSLTKNQPITYKAIELTTTQSVNNEIVATNKIDYLRIATQLADTEEILKAIKSQKVNKPRPELSTTYVPPTQPLHKFIADILVEILAIDKIGIYDDFFALGCDSLQAAMFLNEISNKLNEIIYIVALIDAPNIFLLSNYLTKHYPDSVAKIFNSNSSQAKKISQVDEDKIKQVEISLINPKLKVSNTQKNKTAIFILSAPRSGSTLLRVMLAGHPSLFVPPELHLLSFETMEERKVKLDKFWSQGIIEAIANIFQCDTQQANSILEKYELEKTPVQDFYRLMQSWIGERILVDKTPLYPLDINNLHQAEAYFENTLYIHLLRHPYGMIKSFEEAKLDLILRYNYNYSRQELAEIIWLICQRNILNFLENIPQTRQLRIKYEDLVNNSPTVLNQICDFLGLELHQDMLNPYLNSSSKMTQDSLGQSRMLGDLKFYQHKGINSTNADTWKNSYQQDFLSGMTWEIAARLGYDQSIASINQKPSNYSPLVSIKPTGDRPPLFFVHPISGSVLCYTELAKNLHSNQPFYGLEAIGLNGESPPLNNLKIMAARYIQAIKSIQPKGSYLLGGWSFGGIVAYEMAQQLLQQGDSVKILFLIDSLAPDNFPDLGESHLIKQFACHLENNSGKYLQLSQTDINHLPFDEQIYYIWKQAKATKIIPENLTLRQFRNFWQVYQANFTCLHTYQAQAQAYSNKIILFRALKNLNQDDFTGGWFKYASLDLQTHKISADHYSIMTKPHLFKLLNFYLV